MAFRLFRFRRFSRQLLLLVAGLIAAVQVTVYLSIRSASERNALDHISQNLQDGAHIFHREVRDGIDYLAASAKVMSGDYAIRQALMQEKLDEKTRRSTLSSNLDSYLKRVKKASVITLYSPEGISQATTDETLGAENNGPFQSLINKAASADMEQASGFAYLGGRLHVLVVVPLYAPYPNVYAWFGLAFPIDTSFAQAIKDTTRLEVSFTSDPKESPQRVLATTLGPEMAKVIAEYGAASASPMVGVQTVELAGEPYVTLLEPLPLLGDDPARIALQRSLQIELAPARELEKIVLLISLVALAAAILAASLIARGVSEPVQRLAAFTKYVAAGDYTQRIELPREDELGQLATAFNQMTAGLAERDLVRDLLGKVVSPEIATQLLRSGVQLGGEEREVTILFSDLRSFTTMSEKMAPADMLALLNRYLDRMSTIIEKHGGVINKYIGDAIMALFGAPVASSDAPARAIAAAREMAQALEVLNAELTAEGRPTLAFGIGINTARVVAGNMGSKTRLNYTVIGDGVNLASRLEGLTKEPEYGTLIIVSEATLRAMPNPPPARALGEVKVKGKSEAVKIFAIGAKGESQPPIAV